jgi:serine/threonine-protein kinase
MRAGRVAFHTRKHGAFLCSLVGGGHLSTRYELIRRLRSGRTAEVFFARATEPDGTVREVILKRLLPRVVRAPDFRERVVADVRKAMAISHPNLVQVLAAAEAHESPFIAVEHVDGLTVGELIDKHQEAGRLPPLLATQVVIKACEGLAAAREAGQVRGEISRAKIMLARDGSVKVLDLCAANLQQLSHPVDPRTDVFALGAVLYELLSGHRPWERPPLDVPPTALTTWLPDLSPTLVAVVARALSRVERERFENPRAMADALASGEVEPVQEVVRPPPLPHRSSSPSALQPQMPVATKPAAAQPVEPQPLAASPVPVPPPAVPVDPNAPLAVDSARAALDTLLGRPPSTSASQRRLAPVTSTSASQRGLSPVGDGPAASTSASQRGVPAVAAEPVSSTSGSQRGLAPVGAPPMSSSPSQLGVARPPPLPPPLPPSRPSQIAAPPPVEEALPVIEALPEEPPDPGTSRTASAQAALRALRGEDSKP